jgi:hypothetical protein
MASKCYDEDLSENPFFKAQLAILDTKFEDIELILVPQITSLPSKFDDDQQDLKKHIVTLCQEKNVLTNLLGEQVIITEDNSSLKLGNLQVQRQSTLD